MTRLAPSQYLEHIRNESARFGEALAGASPDARVPSCPDWDASDLLGHLTQVQRFWRRAVEERPTRPEDQEPPRGPWPEMLAEFNAATAGLVDALAAADQADEAWTWWSEHTVGFILRRQAHEALVHRLDAELTVGAVGPIDPLLAADGVEETLSVMFAGVPPWGRFTPGDGLVRLDFDDAPSHVWVRLGQFTGTDPSGGEHDEPDISVVPDPGVEPDAVITGAAADVDAWLWRRGDDAGLRVTGDREVFERFSAIVDQPLN